MTFRIQNDKTLNNLRVIESLMAGRNMSIGGIPYTWPAAQAMTNGQFLENDGTGNLSWAVPPTSVSTYVVVAQDGTGNYNGTDQVPIQAAIDFLNGSANGGTIFIKGGTYSISSPIILKNGANLLGDGILSVNLNGTGGVAYVLKGDVGTLNNINISNLSVGGGATTALIEFEGTLCMFVNVNVDGASPIGVNLIDSGSQVQFNNFLQCDFGTGIVGKQLAISLNTWNTMCANCFFNVGSGSLTAIYTLGLSTRANNCLFINGGPAVFSANVTLFNNCIWAAQVGACLQLDVASSPGLGIPTTAIVNNAFILSFGTTSSFITSDVAATFAGGLVVNGLNIAGAGLTGDTFVWTGLGSHKYSVNGLDSIITSNLSGGGTIDPNSVINEVNIPQSTPPSPTSLGLIYLDDGTNTLSTNPAWRRFNGTSYVDIG